MTALSVYIIYHLMELKSTNSFQWVCAKTD